MLAFAVAVIFGVASVAEVPNPRPASWVSDQAQVLDAAGVAKLDAIAEELHATRGIELAIVTVDDTPGASKPFASELFHAWKIGNAQTNSGVLVLLVMGKRRIEVETGTGMEPVLPAAWLAGMQQDVMVPKLKAGDIAGGLQAGVAAIAQHVREAPAESDSTAARGAYVSSGSGVPSPAYAPPPDRSSGSGGLAIAAVAGGLVVLGGGTGWLVARARRRRKTCQACDLEMTMLDEDADDAHLEPGQRTEERLGSVDYEVLQCPKCQATKTFRHDLWLSSYSVCTSCTYKAMTSDARTVTEATFSNGGEIEVREQCEHCGRDHTYTRSTPMLVDTTTTSSSDFFSSDSSSSSSDSSSSSSDSSFGGGSSDGGGAGSDW